MAAILFDLDDTLYKERHFVVSAYRAVASYMSSITGADPEVLFPIIAKNRPRGFEAALEAQRGMPDVDTISIDKLVQVYRSHTPDIHLDPEVANTLATLKARGHRLGIITDGTVLTQGIKIEALGLLDYVEPDAIWISERTGGDKTTTLPWIAAEKYFGTAPLTYVGDNLSKDFRYPNLRGWRTVMLRDRLSENVFPQRPCDWPAENRAQMTIDSLSQLI